MTDPTILVWGSGRAALEAAREVVAQHGRAVLVRSGAKKTCALRVPRGIEVIDNAMLIRLEGSPGRFSSHLRVGGEVVTINCDAVVLANVASLPDERVPKAMGLDEARAGPLPEQLVSVAIVLDAAADRSAYRRSLDLALDLRARSDRPAVTLFIRDLMVYGRDEIIYAEAQRQGVRVVRSDHSPELTTTDRTAVRAIDSSTGLEIIGEPDLLVVEAGPVSPYASSSGGNAVLGRGNISMGVASTLQEGVFQCGPDEADLLDEELMTNARTAATRALSAALRPAVRAPMAVRVDRDKCAACLTCVRSCPFHAPHSGEGGKAVIEGELCQACGLCVAACPGRALSLPSEQGRDGLLSTMFREAGA
jgi:ferredoxin